MQHVIRLILRTFDELGTLNAVLQYLVRHQIQIGIRVRSGLTKGELEWHRPNRMTLQNLLKHPIYAGAYAYGRRQVDPRGHATIWSEALDLLVVDRLRGIRALPCTPLRQPVHVVQANFWLPIGTEEIWRQAETEDLSKLLR